MEMDHLSHMPSGQSDADIDTTSRSVIFRFKFLVSHFFICRVYSVAIFFRVNLVKLVCSLGTKLMHDEGCTELASLCINILGELLKWLRFILFFFSFTRQINQVLYSL